MTRREQNEICRGENFFPSRGNKNVDWKYPEKEIVETPKALTLTLTAIEFHFYICAFAGKEFVGYLTFLSQIGIIRGTILVFSLQLACNSDFLYKFVHQNKHTLLYEIHRNRKDWVANFKPLLRGIIARQRVSRDT